MTRLETSRDLYSRETHTGGTSTGYIIIHRPLYSVIVASSR